MDLLEVEQREAMRDRVLRLRKQMNEVADSLASHPGNPFIRGALDAAVQMQMKAAVQFEEKWGQPVEMRAEVNDVVGI